MRRPPPSASVCVGLLGMLASLLSWSLGIVSLPPEPVPKEVEAQAEPAVEFALPEKQITRELRAGIRHAYLITLVPNEYLHLRLEQVNADVVITISDSESLKLFVVDSPTKAAGSEELFLAAEEGGASFRAFLDSGKTSGAYVLQVERQSPASEMDRIRARAATALYRAEAQPEPGAAARGFEEALQLFESIGEWSWAREASSRLGRLSSSTSQLAAAVRYHRHAVALARRARDLENQSLALSELVGALRSAGELADARGYALEAVDLARRVGQKSNEASALTTLGDVLAHKGVAWDALEAYRQSLTLWVDLEQRDDWARCQVRLGMVYATLGDPETALDHYARALPILRLMAEEDELGKLHSRMAEAYLRKGDVAEALAHFNSALAYRRRARDDRGEAVTFLGIGKAHLVGGDLVKARSATERALAVFQQLDDSQAIGRAWANLGSIHLGLEQPGQARSCFEKALPRLEQTEDSEGQTLALFGLAVAERLEGNALQARSFAEQALDQIDRLRQAAERPDLQALYHATKQGVYEFLLTLLVDDLEEGSKAAFEVSERSRSQGLLRALSTQSIPFADPQLIERKRRLEHEVADMSREAFARDAAGEPTDRLDRDRRRLLEDLKLLDGTIRQRSPWISRLSRAVSLEEVQNELLDDSTVLLEYFVGNDRSFLWLVTTSTPAVFSLPGRTSLEADVRSTANLMETSHLSATRDQLQGQLKRLSSILLAPVAHLLGDKRLVIVPHDLLHFVPFAALADPTSSAVSPEGWPTPLILRHEIVILPSLSVLYMLRADGKGRKVSDKQLAILADPVFVGEPLGGGGKALPRLEHTRKEADAILQFARRGDTLKLLGHAASKELVLSGRLNGFRYLHFATHARLDVAVPEASSLVLSEQDRTGVPIDGLLQAHEISGLDLSAELVVLSACRTARGREIPGEGPIGLSQAFLHAGAQKVVQSLWDVDDEATAELMARFYRGLLREGLGPAAALRRAQVEMFEGSSFRAPGFWAAFFLQGDWR